jgi:hypothetical protein
MPDPGEEVRIYHATLSPSSWIIVSTTFLDLGLSGERERTLQRSELHQTAFGNSYPGCGFVFSLGWFRGTSLDALEVDFELASIWKCEDYKKSCIISGGKAE